MDNFQDFVTDEDLPPYLKEIYEELNKKGYSKETEEQFSMFALEVAKYHREQAEAQDIDEE